MIMNNEDTDETHDSVRRAVQQIWKQSPNLPDAVAEELKEVLAKLQSLPFKNEEQRASLFDSFQCLRIQGYHIVQVFNVGVARLQKSVREPSKFVANVITLFQMCFNFCYNTDKSKRVSFEHYIRALKLCFPSDPKKSCLSIETVSTLLNLVQILQEGKLCAISFFDFTKPARGPKDLFNEFLNILESKPYGESDVEDVISQALRLACVDANNHTFPMKLAEVFPHLPFQLDQMIPAFFFEQSFIVKSNNKRKKSKTDKGGPNNTLTGKESDPEKQQKERTTLLIGDSMISRIPGKDLGKAVGHRVIVKPFSGATTMAMNHYLKPNLEYSPNEVILHIGTNDLKTKEPKAVAESIVDLARQIEGTCDTTVTLSELVCRKDKLDQAVKTANKHLKKFCHQNGWKLIHHENISHSGLNKGGLHLNFKGNEQFYNNFKSHLE